MTYPFPGMNPYLEQPIFWASFHSRLIVALADTIEAALQPDYYVEVESRTYLSERDGGLLIGIPDVVVATDAIAPPSSSGSPALATQVRPQRVTLPMPEAVTERYLEIREFQTGAVITAIEVLSPKNKQPGQGRSLYTAKRNQVLSSLTNLVEIDLLGRGDPLTALDGTNDSSYRILVSTGSQRPTADLYLIALQQPLPMLPIPLKPADEPIPVPLQALVEGIYARGRYHNRIDYRQPPPPPSLADTDRQWLAQVLEAGG